MPFVEHSTPSHAAEQVSLPVQLKRRLSCLSVWRRNWVRASVSFCHALSATQRMVKANDSDRFMEEGSFMLGVGTGQECFCLFLFFPFFFSGGTLVVCSWICSLISQLLTIRWLFQYFFYLFVCSSW